MKTFCTLFLCFIYCTANAQTFKVLDAVTNQPVPFATVLAMNNGEQQSRDYCSQDGSVTISVKSYDFLQISCIGYKEKALGKADVSTEILLEPEALQLDEVVISRRAEVVTVGYIDKKKLSFSGTAAGFTDAVYIVNTTGKATYVKSFLFKIVKAKNRFAYRLHFYKPAVGKNHPGEEITPANIIGFVEKGAKGLTELDLLGYTIEFPEGGVYVGVEGLGACNADGAILDTKEAYITYEDFESAEFIFFHQPDFFIKNGWINENERVLRDYKETMMTNPPKGALRVPSFGLKVYK